MRARLGSTTVRLRTSTGENELTKSWHAGLRQRYLLTLTHFASDFAPPRRRRKIEQQNEQLEVLLTEVNTLRAESSSSLKNDSDTVKQLKAENDKLREVRMDKNTILCKGTFS